jgi:hypothetical protein
MTAARALAAVAALWIGAAPALGGPPHCPPGHAKKGWCRPGEPSRIPARAERWEGWRDRGLRPPRDGEIYVRLDREVWLVLEATREVLEAVGAVERVLTR